MSFPAKRPFVCIRCSQTGKVGELITWNRKLKGQITHIKCQSNIITETVENPEKKRILTEIFEAWGTDKKETRPRQGRSVRLSDLGKKLTVIEDVQEHQFHNGLEWIMPLKIPHNCCMDSYEMKLKGQETVYVWNGYWVPSLPLVNGNEISSYVGNADWWIELDETPPVVEAIEKEPFILTKNHIGKKVVIVDKTVSYYRDWEKNRIEYFEPVSFEYPFIIQKAYIKFEDFSERSFYNGRVWEPKIREISYGGQDRVWGYHPSEKNKTKGGDEKMETTKALTTTDSNKNIEPLKVFIDALLPQIQKGLTSSIDETKVKALIDSAFKDRLPKEIHIKHEDKTIIKIESAHKDLETLMYFINKRHHVYLYGPAGGGKSTSAQQISEALKLPFGYISLNPQTPDSRLLGFIDAGGTYRESVFYKIYKSGGVFCIDEMDNASASLLTTLNSMLENGHGAFPNGLVERHKDFVLVATGNTNGRGGNPMFPERRPFDMAFAERFTFLFWDYDSALERSIALAINPKSSKWVDYIQGLRKYVQKEFPKVLVSPRASFKGAEYLKDNHLTVDQVLEAIIFKGLDKDTIKKIVSANPLPTK